MSPSTSGSSRPGIGVGVVVVNTVSKKVYAGIRRGSHGAARLALPGGHLEHGESWETCAQREVAEEMGLSSLHDLRYLHVTNDIMVAEKKHYVTIFMVARTEEIPQNLEPDKCEGWKEYTLEELQSKKGQDALFIPLENLLRDNPPILQEYVGSVCD